MIISKYTWQVVKDFFAKNPDEVKFSRRESGKNYSFHKFNDQILAVANKNNAINAKSLLGEGGFGKVKIALDENNTLHAVKIEKLRQEYEIQQEPEEFKIQQTVWPQSILNYRNFANQEANGDNIIAKRYIKMPLIDGPDLWARIHSKENPLTLEEKYKIALGCVLALENLHNKHIIHADLKPENIKANGEPLYVNLLDFGLSLKKPENQFYVYSGAAGTPKYMAPEIWDEGKYSFASDIYALGIMFTEDLDLEENTWFFNRRYSDMCSNDPRQRPHLDEIKQRLIDDLKQIGAQPGRIIVNATKENRVLEDQTNELKKSLNKVHFNGIKGTRQLYEVKLKAQKKIAKPKSLKRKQRKGPK